VAVGGDGCVSMRHAHEPIGPAAAVGLSMRGHSANTGKNWLHRHTAALSTRFSGLIGAH
jgi:hypothetical protein